MEERLSSNSTKITLLSPTQQKEVVYQIKHSQLHTTVYLDKPELLIAKNYQLSERQQKIIKKCLMGKEELHGIGVQ